MHDNILTIDEQNVLHILAEAWNGFLTLPELHEWENQEFMNAIHLAQMIVMSRPVLRERLESGGGRIGP